MFKYILKRIFAMIPTLFGITLITFFIINMAPGDPVATQFGANAEQDAGGGGGGQDQDRLADAIKAKKRLLGMMTENKVVMQWTPSDQDGTEVRPLSSGPQLSGFDDWIHAMAQHGDNVYLAGDAGIVYVLDANGAEIARHTGFDLAIWSMAVSAQGAIAIGDSQGNLRAWSAAGTEAFSAEGDGKPIRDLLFTHDGAGLISASADSFIRRYSATTGAVEHKFEGHNAGVYALALSSDGSQFWSGGQDRTLRLWSVDGGPAITEVAGHQQAINDIALSADGTALATASDDRILRLFPVAANGLGAPKVFEGHYKQATAVALSADGTRLFSGGRDETIRTWDIVSGDQLEQAPEATGRVHDLLVRNGALYSASESWRTVPIVWRYVHWIQRLAVLDFDRSFIDDEPVIDKIKKALPITMGLNIIAIIIIYGVSIPIGVAAAVWRGQAFDNISSIVLFVLYSIPNFWLATMLIMLVGSRQNWDLLPSVGLHSLDAGDLSFFPWLFDWGLHLVLPLIVMVYTGFARLSRFVRTSMLETIQQDYIRTARAKGLAEHVVVFKHAFRNSLIVIVTLVGNLLPAMIGGSVIVEFIFSINGMGKLGFDAILSRDYPTIMAITTFSAFLTLMGILISDILYGVVDPRVVQK